MVNLVTIARKYVRNNLISTAAVSNLARGPCETRFSLWLVLVAVAFVCFCVCFSCSCFFFFGGGGVGSSPYNSVAL